MIEVKASPRAIKRFLAKLKDDNSELSKREQWLASQTLDHINSENRKTTYKKIVCNFCEKESYCRVNMETAVCYNCDPKPE